MSTPTPLQPTDSAPTPGDWWTHWQTSPDFQLEREFIRLLGATQEFRRQRLLDLLAQRCYGRANAVDLKPRFDRLLVRLIKEWKFVRQFQVTAVQPAAPAQFLMCLLPPGETAFARLEPHEQWVRFSPLQVRYVSYQRLYLALEARDVLNRAGYAVELAPAAIPLASGTKFKPDLMVRQGDSAQIVQVERIPQFWVPATRARKWRRVMEATRGQVYLVADTAGAMAQLQAELRAMRFDRPGVLRLTNLQQADQYLATHGTVWMVKEPLR